ncbi:MAG: bifunctional DNA-formamidopyrimidine glycosylase/DNA-(apurinic or apyrimidinic site) lyase [Desulfobacteraceae bacterium]|nr:bifunctional DNA-formamidopyrimidine glycosylase/DNA-(apurinic or apyrimidinic site) lyase [Desulfobacteraceae bacterium]
MPELPEVQTIVNDLNAADLVGHTILRAGVYWPRTIANQSPQAFCRQLEGQTINAIGRRAKLILFELTDGWLLAVHLRMTGRFELGAAAQSPQKHMHVQMELDDGRALQYFDTRKFGRFTLVADPRSMLESFGPEPLSAAFTAKVLARQLMGRHRQIKPLLLDQSVIAGLGNIYVDEALWAARIHPERSANHLESDEIKALHKAIRQVLKEGLRHNGTTLGHGQSNFYSLNQSRGRNEHHLKVFRRTGQPCPECGRPIVRIIVGQRSTHVCRHCQR